MARNHLPYVQMRNGVYQFVRRVPQDVTADANIWLSSFGGQRFYRRSLRTKSDAEAAIRLIGVRAEFDRSLSEARQQLARRVSSVGEACKSLPKKLTQETIKSYARELFRTDVESWSRAILLAETSSLQRDALDHRIEREAERRHLRKKIEGNPNLSDKANGLDDAPINIARAFVQRGEIEVEEGSVDFALLVRSIREAQESATETVNTMLSGRHALPIASAGTFWGAAELNASHAKKTDVRERTFAELVTQYEEVTSLRPRTKQKYHKSQQAFIGLVGAKPINDISRGDITNFLDRQSKRTVMRKGEAMQISPQTLLADLRGISAPLGFAIDRDMMAGPNPCTGIKPERWCRQVDKLKVPPKRPFSNKEMRDVFRHPWFKGVVSADDCHSPGLKRLKDMRFWAPVIAAHTGARAAELAGLMLDDVKLHDRHPHFHLRPNKYRGVKNGHERFVPILDALLHLDIEKYVAELKSSGSDRLFPDWKFPGHFDREAEGSSSWSNAKWIRAFNGAVLDRVLPDVRKDVARSPVTFHSFRGSFKTLLSSIDAGIYTNAVIGHSQNALDRAYLSKQQPEDLYDRFRGLVYSGVELTSPYSTNAD